MGQDALATTHPIVQKVRTVEQANQAFDSITYSKGESVLNMLEGYAGADVWQRGIQAYIRAHAYRNTRTDDLWRAVEAAGAKGLTQIAHDFTLQPGVPLIRVGAVTCEAGQSRVILTQDEFSSDRKPGSFAPLSWHVPVRLRGRRTAGDRSHRGARDAGDGAGLRAAARERRADRLLPHALPRGGGGAAPRRLHAHRPARRIWPRQRPARAVGGRLPADGDRARPRRGDSGSMRGPSFSRSATAIGPASTTHSTATPRAARDRGADRAALRAACSRRSG